MDANPAANTTVTLAPLREDDREELFLWINDRQTVLRNAPYAPVSWAQHVAWFDALPSRTDRAIFGIRTADGRLVGSCQLHDIHPVHRSAELQLRIGRAENRGRGFGRQAVRALLDHGFRDRNLHRIYLHVFADNAAAIGLYERCGFIHEGRLREAAFIDGLYKDILVMGKLRAEDGAR